MFSDNDPDYAQHKLSGSYVKFKNTPAKVDSVNRYGAILSCGDVVKLKDLEYFKIFGFCVCAGKVGYAVRRPSRQWRLGVTQHNLQDTLGGLGFGDILASCNVGYKTVYFYENTKQPTVLTSDILLIDDKILGKFGKVLGSIQTETRSITLKSDIFKHVIGGLFDEYKIVW